MLKSGKQVRLVLAAMAAVFCGTGFSATQIPQGIRFFISKDGQKYFQTNFEELLLRQGQDLSRMHFDRSQFDLKNPFNSENLPKPVREKQADLLKRLTANFSMYFSGLSLGDPDFQVSMEDYGYQLKFDRLAIELDPRGPKAYGLTRGVVALLRGEASEFKFNLSRVRATDVKNPKFLGTLGANNFKAKLLEGDVRPGRIEVPVVIDTNAQGLTVKVLAVRTNFTKLKLEGAFEALLLPSMKIVINGITYDFDQKAFENDFRKFLPEILQVVQGGVKSWFEQTSGKEIFQPQLDEVAKLATISFQMPLAEPTRPERIELKVQPARVSLDEKNFMLEFSAQMKDPLFARGAGVFPTVGSSTQPTLRYVPSQGYDVAIAVHPAIINGFVDRLFAYKFLDRMKIDDETEVTMTAPPVFHLDLANPKQAILHVLMETDADSIAVRSMVPIEFDLRVHLEANSRNEIDIIPEEILMDTVFVDRKKLKTWLFGALKGKVEKRVREKLAKSNEGFRTKPSVMKSIPTLDDVLGIPLRLVDVATDGGNIVIFSKYDVK